MKAQRFARTKAVAQGGAIALLVAALVFAVATRVFHRPTNLSGFELTASTNFSITSAISSSSSTQSPAVLSPGAPRFLWYTVHNTLSVPITVSSLSIPSASAPTGCPVSNLDISHTTFTGSLVVPAKVGAAAGTSSVSVPISLIATAPPGCQNVTFDFTYAGNGKYTEVYATSTALVSSTNPSNVGQAVTYTATVTATVGANQDPVPNAPTGTVTFKDGSTTVCSSVALVSAATATATATCSPSAYASAATHPITAVYTNVDGNFSTSTSPALSQVVQSSGHANTTTALTSTPNPSAFGTSVSFTATVTKSSGSGTPTGSISFFSGTPVGTHSLLGTGTLNSSRKATLSTSSLPAGSNNVYAVYGGNATFAGSTSPVTAQVVIALPSGCTNPLSLKVGNPAFPILNGTNGNDLLYAAGASFLVNGLNGNDCLSIGNGNNIITDGNGNNVVLTGNGNSVIVVGNGNNRVTVGNGANGIVVGNGNNTVTLGGSRNVIVVGKGDNTVYLGAGTYNTFVGGRGHNVCHLPAPPSSWHGTTAGYYHDSISNCTVVTP